jgi:hypothetical protein
VVGKARDPVVARVHPVERAGRLPDAAIERGIAVDSVKTGIGAGRDRGVARARDAREVVDRGVREPRTPSSKPRQRRQRGIETIPRLQAEPVEDEQQDGRRNRPGTLQGLRQDPPGHGGRRRLAEQRQDRGCQILLSRRTRERAGADERLAMEQERNRDVVAPGASMHESVEHRIGPREEEVAPLRDQEDLAAASRHVAAREHLHATLALRSGREGFDAGVRGGREDQGCGGSRKGTGGGEHRRALQQSCDRGGIRNADCAARRMRYEAANPFGDSSRYPSESIFSRS